MKRKIKFKNKEYIELNLIKLSREEKEHNIIEGYFHKDSLDEDDWDNNVTLLTNLNNKKYYNLTPSKEYTLLGYIQIDENRYVGFTRRNNTILIVLFLCLFLSLCSLGWTAKTYGFSLPWQFKLPQIEWFKSTDNSIIDKQPIETTPAGITDISDLLYGNGGVETLSVPQFSDLYLRSSNYIPLMNVPENNVYMEYEIYDTENNLVFKSEKPIPPNSEDRWYISEYEPGDYEFIIVAYMADLKGNRGNSVSFNTTIHIIK